MLSAGGLYGKRIQSEARGDRERANRQAVRSGFQSLILMPGGDARRDMGVFTEPYADSSGLGVLWRRSVLLGPMRILRDLAMFSSTCEKDWFAELHADTSELGVRFPLPGCATA